MKFNQEFKTHLLQDGFPPEWVESAISYRLLKKSIKRVETELQLLGLDVGTLKQLLQTVENEHGEREDGSENGGDDESDRARAVRYEIEQRQIDAGKGKSTSPNGNQTSTPFRPKLLFAVDEETGDPIDARLSAETKNHLHQLAVAEGLTNIRIVDDTNDPSTSLTRQHSHDSDTACSKPHRHIKLVEVPLTSDGEFFSVLSREVSGLTALQNAERDRLAKSIAELGVLLADLTGPSSRAGSRALAHDNDEWRKVFDTYLQAQVFFGSVEKHRGPKDSVAARENLLLFLERTQGVRFKRKQSQAALLRFVDINMDFLRGLQFQELNSQAVRKIVKKFDKRTGLGVKGTLLSAADFTPALEMAGDFAKHLSAEVSSRILAVVPRLDDYLCPICFSVAYKPVRLRCEHVFCIRCLITMQKGKKDHCPMCRREVVMEADSLNLDPELKRFLKLNFPTEVKIKQKENEMMAAEDQFGPFYDPKCVIM